MTASTNKIAQASLASKECLPAQLFTLKAQMPICIKMNRSKTKSSWMIWDFSQYNFQDWKSRCWSRADEVLRTPLHQSHFNLQRKVPSVTEVPISPLLGNSFLIFYFLSSFNMRCLREQRTAWNIYSVP